MTGVQTCALPIYSAVVTAANVHDKHPLAELLHGNERRVYGDSAYASQKELIRDKVRISAIADSHFSVIADTVSN